MTYFANKEIPTKYVFFTPSYLVIPIILNGVLYICMTEALIETFLSIHRIGFFVHTDLRA